MKIVPAAVSVLLLGLGIGSLIDSAMPTHKRVLTELATVGDGTGPYLDYATANPPAVLAPKERRQQTAPTAHSGQRQEKQISLMDRATNCSAGTKACGNSCISIEKTCRLTDERVHRGVGCGKSYIAVGKVCHVGSRHRKRYETRVAKLKTRQ